jgi:hypothetical protein
VSVRLGGGGGGGGSASRRGERELEIEERFQRWRCVRIPGMQAWGSERLLLGAGGWCNWR